MFSSILSKSDCKLNADGGDRNRSERLSAQGGKDIEFEELPTHPDDEREIMLNAENGIDGADSDDERIEVV